MCGAVAGTLGGAQRTRRMTQRAPRLHGAVLAALVAALAVLAVAAVSENVPEATAVPEASRKRLSVVAILAGPDPARRRWAAPLLRRLSEDGHQVEVVEMEPDTDVRKLQERASEDTLKGLRDAHRLGRALSEWQVRQLQQVLLPRAADVLLADYHLNDAGLLVAWRRLRRPSAVVLVSAEASPPRWVLRAAGSLPPPFAAPSGRASLTQRVVALALTVYDHWLYHWTHLPAERLLSDAARPQDASSDDLDLPVTAVLTNELSGLDQDAVSAARVYQVAGLDAATLDSERAEGLVETIASFGKSQQFHGDLAVLVAVVQVGARARPYLDRVLDAIQGSLDGAGVVLVSVEGSHSWLLANSTRKQFAWIDGASVVLDRLHVRSLVAVWLAAPSLAHAAALAGVPSLGLPMDSGEAELADKLVRTGAAARLQLVDLREPARIGRAILDVLADTRMRRDAEALREVLSRSPSPLQRAVEAVEFSSLAEHADDARLGAVRTRRPPLLRALQLDAVLVLVTLAVLAVTAAAAFSALVLTLLCYRKRTTRPKPKRA